MTAVQTILYIFFFSIYIYIYNVFYITRISKITCKSKIRKIHFYKTPPKWLKKSILYRIIMKALVYTPTCCCCCLWFPGLALQRRRRSSPEVLPEADGLLLHPAGPAFCSAAGMGLPSEGGGRRPAGAPGLGVPHPPQWARVNEAPSDRPRHISRLLIALLLPYCCVTQCLLVLLLIGIIYCTSLHTWTALYNIRGPAGTRDPGPGPPRDPVLGSQWDPRTLIMFCDWMLKPFGRKCLMMLF